MIDTKEFDDAVDFPGERNCTRVFANLQFFLQDDGLDNHQPQKPNF